MTTTESLTINILSRGTYSVPVNSNLMQITGGINMYSHSITARGGCESCNFELDVPLEESNQYLDLILCHVRVIDQYAQQVWAGMISSIDISYGSATVSIGVDNFASRFAYFRSDSTSPSTTLFDSNVAQTYCDKYMPAQVKAKVGGASQEVAHLTALLNLFGAPNVQTRISAETRSSQKCRVTINAVGYYSTLQWTVVTATRLGDNTTSDDFAVTMLNLAKTNNNYFDIGFVYGSTGVTIPNTASWDAYSTYAQIIEDVLNAGTSGGLVLAWGIQPYNNLFELSISQVNYKTIHYVKSLSSAKVYASSGNEIPPTQVLPDRNLSVPELKPLYQQYGLSSIPGLQYIDRVSLQIDRNGYQLNLEPSGIWDSSFELARLIKDRKWRFSTR